MSFLFFTSTRYTADPRDVLQMHCMVFFCCTSHYQTMATNVLALVQWSSVTPLYYINNLPTVESFKKALRTWALLLNTVPYWHVLSHPFFLFDCWVSQISHVNIPFSFVLHFHHCPPFCSFMQYTLTCFLYQGVAHL